MIDFACRLAKHRGKQSLHRNDVRLAFEKRLKVKVPAKISAAPNRSAQNNAVGAASSNVGGSAASANLPPLIPTPHLSTSNYKSSLTLVKKAQE